jgi:hypothetical protein
MSIIAREYEDLRAQRVALRRKREHLVEAAGYAPQNRYGVDGYDNAIATIEVMLRGTEKRWQELHLLLGKRIPGPPVKLNAPVQRARGTAIRYAGPYLTRDMAPR